MAREMGSDLVVPHTILRSYHKRSRRKSARSKTKSAQSVYEEVRDDRSEARKQALDNWNWPFLRQSDGPEFACPHGIGHSEGVHGCDWCCKHPSFPREPKRKTQWEMEF